MKVRVRWMERQAVEVHEPPALLGVQEADVDVAGRARVRDGQVELVPLLPRAVGNDLDASDDRSVQGHGAELDRAAAAGGRDVERDATDVRQVDRCEPQVVLVVDRTDEAPAEAVVESRVWVPDRVV